MQLSEHGMVIYKAMLDQLNFLKKQQWTITNYLVLIYAGCSGSPKTFQRPGQKSAC